ncbi:ABC-type transport auxiliary lipoprotein family protein [Viridibacterium curvum]|uniref:ABC-type transport auxiliary lipoprotein component domain-containing protein n=1 Tax=Viridibacterium curvum TaxID=1101404 RepID=A0ABP9Q964_9RHOO
MTRRISMRPLILSSALLMLAACSTPSPAPQLTQHDLGGSFPAGATRSPVPLRSLQVIAQPVVASTAMLYRERAQPTRRGVYASNRWAAPPSSMVEAALTRSLGLEGGARCRLQISLGEFIVEVEQGGAAQAVVSADAQLLRDAQQLVTQRSFDLRVPLQGSGPATGALALRTAVEQLAAQSAAWLDGDAARVCRS